MCDTTSGIHGIGKGLALKKIKRDAEFQEQDEVFNNEDVTKSDIITIGEKALVLLYNAGMKSGYSRFFQKITTGTSFPHPECLPATSAAAINHSLRVYHQVQQWRGVALRPQDWGWKPVDGSLAPVRTDLPAAQVSLLEIIRCRKHGLDCSAALGTCRREICTNSASPDFSINDE